MPIVRKTMYGHQYAHRQEIHVGHQYAHHQESNIRASICPSSGEQCMGINMPIVRRAMYGHLYDHRQEINVGHQYAHHQESNVGHQYAHLQKNNNRASICPSSGKQWSELSHKMCSPGILG
jgi:hypothetical protein